jgi:hypothetical protein
MKESTNERRKLRRKEEVKESKNEPIAVTSSVGQRSSGGIYKWTRKRRNEGAKQQQKPVRLALRACSCRPYSTAGAALQAWSRNLQMNQSQLHPQLDKEGTMESTNEPVAVASSVGKRRNNGIYKWTNCGCNLSFTNKQRRNLLMNQFQMNPQLDKEGTKESTNERGKEQMKEETKESTNERRNLRRNEETMESSNEPIAV